ncbi:ATP-binding protein [Burkholderia cepacia]|uniref:hypothetical protein n=1 Tax=Burkholderia cepacia TaxID=292 RepID=UPI001C9343AB|nr:hypothetical protein [Burkholderia cepacia]MBY4714902.1 hypothetical protein [Burkholderia cepacia]MBY4739009.1 hypothetical protein [Burkholderia cepacia]MBY4744070.1 hypothetical protein [Burkholderia cepacia]MBY4757055.1 hypothetical protein [Burkholderia cepacia]MBY4777077.1 hypothetical protein [Burkholderia cepacia]
MDLTQNVSLDSLEEHLLTLSGEQNQPLRLVTTPHRPTPFCVEAMMLQFIVTAARKGQDKLVARFMDLNASSEVFDATLRKGFGNPHVLVAWVMAQTAEDARGTKIERTLASHFNSYLDAMESYDFMHTHDTAELRANLICVQRAHREYVRSLYAQVDGKYVLRPYPEVRLVVQDILSQLAPHWSGQHLRDTAGPLASLLRELMENADWWARTDVNGNLYQSGVRAVTFRLVHLDHGNLSVFAGSNIHLQAYLSQALGQTAKSLHGERPSRTFIEMSVADSGPGLARRWLASKEEWTPGTDPLASVSTDVESEAIAECFKKWRTSSNDANRGIGLFSVARILRERNGFLRLRTGRLAYLFGTDSAINDIERRVKTAKKSDDYALLSDGTHVFFDGIDVTFFLRPWGDAACAAVDGTSYSILLPVRS